MRLFVAIELEEALLNRIMDLVGKLRGELPKIRWSRREAIHLTLRFLGEVDAGRVAALEESLSRSAARATGGFTVEVEGLGTFGDRRRPRVVWAGVQERSGALESLRGAVEEASLAVGFEGEERPFRPHLTLARLKHSHPDLGRALATRAAVRLGSSLVKSFSLIESRLSTEGASYSRVALFGLGTGPPTEIR
jgi:2'-5' RNA ligase